jgi:hypothetical protein
VSAHVTDIIFSAPMIRALLAGRKTQTRRLCWGKAKARMIECAHGFDTCPECDKPKRTKWASLEAGTLIYVRETCRAVERSDGVDGVLYEADEQWFPIANTAEAADRWVDLYHYRGTRGAKVNAIHMPRWASRLTLELTGVPKIERLQDISEADAIAEGIRRFELRVAPTRIPAPGEVLPRDAVVYAPQWPAHPDLIGESPQAAYRCLWRRLHGAESWDANPEVAVLYFRVHQVNIDQMKEAA